MPTLRLLPGGLPQFASPGFVLSGRPSFDVQAGAVDRLAIDWTAVGAGSAITDSDWYSADVILTGAARSGSVVSVLVQIGVGAGTIANRVVFADGRRLSAEVSVFALG